MIITYHGEGSFRLQSGETSLLVDSTNKRLKADIMLHTAVNFEDFKDDISTISFPGEYEIKGIEIEGYPISGDGKGENRSVYVLIWEGFHIAVLGKLAKLPDAEILDHVGGVDVMLMEIGGKDGLSEKLAAELVKKTSPSAIVPSFVKSPNEFLKAMEQKVKSQEKFVFKKKDLELGSKKIVVLEEK